MIINSLNSTNQTTEITKINQISSKDDNFDKLVEKKENLSPEEKKKLGVKEQINKFFGESSFSNALYDELTKGINNSTSNEELVAIVEKLIVIDLYINNTLEQLANAIEKGIEPTFNPRKKPENTDFINELKDTLSKLKNDNYMDDKNQRSLYTDLLTKVLDKTIQYENEKKSILTKNSNTPNPFNKKEIL